MKLSFRSFMLILSMVWAGCLSFTSCKKENNDPVKQPKPLLATTSYYLKDGTLGNSTSYRYDAKDRVVEINPADEIKIVFEYSSSMVTTKEYENGQLNNTTILTLNAKGKCISAISDHDTITYSYDGNGYFKTCVQQDGNSTLTETYTVSSQNYTSKVTEYQYTSPDFSQISKSGKFLNPLLIRSLGNSIATENTLKSASNQTYFHKTDFSFYTDKPNTIDIENMGCSFLGKQNNNPVKQKIVTSTGRPADTISYSYEYDDKGRITKKTYSSGDYEVYTYVD